MTVLHDVRLTSTSGFPYPQNTALAKNLENLVRQNGAIPATIGVLNGTACVGFTSEGLEELTAAAGKPETKKLSRRDLGYICGLVRFYWLRASSWRHECNSILTVSRVSPAEGLMAVPPLLAQWF